jgi:glycosyltransferase involved in cell wall biosynthesis
MSTHGHQAGRRPIILSMLGSYWPGNDSSGPIKSFKSIAQALSSDFEFRLLARDRAFGAITAMAPSHGGWTELGFAKVRYLAVGRLGAGGLAQTLRDTPHDMLWLNGFFDREFTLPALGLRRAGMVSRSPALLSPRGEFGSGALGLKGGRKRLYLAACRAGGLLGQVTLHATSEAERQDIASGVPWAKDFAVAPNASILPELPDERDPRDGPFRLAFIGRIARVKNLDYALRVLANVRAPIQFSIYGPIQEADHWQACQKLIARLPAHVTVEHKGEIANDKIALALAGADLLFIPTKGENFGHAIFEALSNGVPVLISDATPWRGLTQAQAGWDLPLAEPERFTQAIDQAAVMPFADLARMRIGARDVAENWIAHSDAVAATVAMLQGVMSTTPQKT